jgi:hypothetical protein
MKVGDRVRVIESVVVYHHPEHKSDPFDVKGLEGEVKGIVTEWRGRPVSANLPVLVEFSKKSPNRDFFAYLSYEANKFIFAHL